METSHARFAPQVTTLMADSVHFHHLLQGQVNNIQTPRNLVWQPPAAASSCVQYQFDQSTIPLLKCKCQVFLGTVEEIKGNEVRVVIYLHAVNSAKGDVDVHKEGRVSHALRTVRSYLPSRYVQFGSNQQGRWRLKKVFLLVTAFLVTSVALALVLHSFLPQNQPPDPTPRTTTTTTPIPGPGPNTTTTPPEKNTTTLLPPRSTTDPPHHDALDWDMGFACLLGIPIFMMVALISSLLYKELRRREEVLRTQPYYLAISRSSSQVRALVISYFTS